MTIDAVAFEQAVRAGAWADAVALYGGPFLDGVYVGGSPAFEQWLDGERARLDGLFLRAAAARVEELRVAGDRAGCIEAARRWLNASPLSTEAAAALMDALTGEGTRDGDFRALEAFDKLTTLLGEEYGRRPDRTLLDRARAIVERLKASDATGEFRVPEHLLRETPLEPPAPPPTPLPSRPTPEPVPQAAAARPRRRGRLIAVAVTVAAVVGLAWLGLRERRSPAPSPEPEARPAVAIGAIRASGDSATAWLAEGLVQMVAAKLARTSGVDVIAPERMRELLPPGASLSQLLEAARKAGARWAVSGAVTRSEQGLVMDVNVHAVEDGRLVSLTTVVAANPIALADRAAVQVLNAAGSTAGGPALAEIETSSVEAYERFVEFTLAHDEGRTVDAIAALDAAIALDSGFVSALRERATLAFPRKESAVLQALLSAFQRHAGRATEYDRLYLASQTAFYAAEPDRSQAVARQLVERYPRDPRAVRWLADIYVSHGDWEQAEQTLLRLIALDSLATRPAAGVCIPCTGYSQLGEVRHSRGDMDGAESAVRRLVALAPDVGQGWVNLATILAARGRYDEAERAAARARQIAPASEGALSITGRVLMMRRDLARADSFVRELRRSASPGLRPVALDLAATLARERGQWRASIAALDSMNQLGLTGLNLVLANSHARIGNYGVVARWTAATPPRATPRTGAQLRGVETLGDEARTWSWHRAQEADDILPSGDTLRIRILADSLERLSGMSYYGRDWRLHHHVRGLLLARAGRHADAVQAFQSARWSALGWTRTSAELAQSYLALGRVEDALTALREAYLTPPDGMGRYLPRSELDFLMATAFRQAGQADSAAVYAGYVRAAWAEADPETRARLAELR